MAEPSKLGRYELRRILGKGAMGVVYEGYDPTLDRAVAVKTILKSVVTDEETAASYSARFAREAKAAGRLSHPHIVQVYDFGEENEVAFLAMEFIQGRELRACFEARERFSMPEATRIMGELLDALDFAHQAGVIHRDVKPGNIMLDDQRRVKLADFGVARIQDGTDRSRSGAMVGTPAFMSPEQITGGKLDRRSDLFSAGVVLYQLLTNELPFKGSGAWTVAKQIMQDEPPRPSTVSTRVSPAFDAVVNRALAKKADQRYASAKEFAVALQGALTGEMAPEVRRGGDAEIEFWRTIQGSNDPAEFEVYLKEFPQGIYADLARIKISKLPRLRAIDLAQASLPPSQRSVEVVRLSEDTAKLEVELAKREAEYRKRELEAEARRLAEEKARAEAEAKREAEEQERAAAGERARLVAIESAKQEARAAVARREAELRQREAEAIEKVEAEVKARRSLEERMRREAEVRRADEARARADAEAREKRQADEAAARRAEMQQREEELTRRAAQAPRGGMPVIPAAVAFLVIIAAALGGWYWSRSSDEARLAQLTDALEAATRATQELNAARQRQEELRKQVDVARLAEDDARAKGDQTKLKELQEKTKLAEAEAQKQNELVKQREADAKKAEGAARIAEAGKQGDAAKAAQEKLAAEKLAQEKVAADKAAAEKAAAEKLAAEKAAAEKAAAEKAAVAKAAPRPAAPAGRVGWPAVGDRWVYEVRETNHPDRSFPVTVEVLAVTASDIRETVKAGDAAAMEIVHNAALAAFYSGRPGAHEVLPYLRAFQEFRAGESLARISAAQMIPGCMDGSTHCSARGKVVGREQVTVKAGTFDAWKIEIDFSFLPTRAPVVGATGIVWYSESARRFVKSEFRCRACTTQPNTDRELVSYTLGTAQAAAEKPAAKAAPGWPSAGDRWSYEAREVRRPDQKFLLDVEVLSASAAGIRETQTSQGGTVELTHRPGAQLVGVAPGIVSFAPYLRAFQELRNGDQWADVGIQNVPCAPKNSGSAVCQAMARVVGRERVSVPAGGFDAWKIAVDFKWTETFTTTVGQFSRDSREPRPFSIERTASETDQYFYWYAEDARRTVKYQSRIKTSAGSDVDMELVSYRPAEKSVAAGASSSHASALEQFKLRRGGADVVKKLPFSEQMREGQVVYVDDGSCPEGEISEATGGNPRAGLPRKLRCIKLTE